MWHEYYYRDRNEKFQAIEDIISKVRLSLISMNDLLKIVRYSNLFDLNHIMDAIENIHIGTNIGKNYRGRLSKKKRRR